MVLRLPNIKGGYKAKKEPTKDYTLYLKDGRIFSSASGDYSTNNDCGKVASNVRSNSSQKANSESKSGANLRNNKTTTKKSIGNIEMQSMNLNSQNQVNNLTNEKSKEENQGGVFSKCSIL